MTCAFLCPENRQIKQENRLSVPYPHKLTVHDAYGIQISDFCGHEEYTVRLGSSDEKGTYDYASKILISQANFDTYQTLERTK